MATGARGEARRDRVLKEVEATVAELRTAGVRLTDADFEVPKDDAPPTVILTAGPEFVESWREYRRALSLKKTFQPQPQQRGKNVLEQSGEYERLVSELLDGPRPPTPEQIAQFFYDDYSWCGTDSGTFASANQQAILLACLRHHRLGEALQILLNSSGLDKLRAELLTALGFDWRKVVAGAWLAGESGMLESLCKDGSEEGAQLALRWAELHWDEAVKKRALGKRINHVRDISQPQLPAMELLHFLARGIAVTEATKERIATFLHTNATRLQDAGYWLRRPPAGAEQWLKPIARSALQHERNQVRLMGEKVLRDAGEADVRAELRPAARYRLLVDGELYVPNKSTGGIRHLGLNIKHGPAGSQSGLATSADPDREGIITTDPDYFRSGEVIHSANFYTMPDSSRKPASPTEPWVRADIPLPPAFGQTTDIRVETVEVTIQPRFPRPAQEYNGTVSEVAFTWAEEGRQPNEHELIYHLIGHNPLVLSRVQPGEYWLRVRAPGAAIGRWEEIGVTKEKTKFEPNLDVGASVSIPLRWPEELKLEALDPELADFFRRSWWAGLPPFFTVDRDGKSLRDAAIVLEATADDSRKDLLLLRNLPVGRYRVAIRSSAEIRAGLEYLPKPERPYAGWKAAEVSFEVNARSPREFTSTALKIEPAP